MEFFSRLNLKYHNLLGIENIFNLKNKKLPSFYYITKRKNIWDMFYWATCTIGCVYDHPYFFGIIIDQILILITSWLNSDISFSLKLEN